MHKYQECRHSMCKELNHIVFPGKVVVDHAYMHPPHFIDLMDQRRIAIPHTTPATQELLTTKRRMSVILVEIFFLDEYFNMEL